MGAGGNRTSQTLSWWTKTTADANQSLTRFVGGDGELVARVAVADDVLGHHADVVGGGGVEVDDGGLVELR